MLPRASVLAFQRVGPAITRAPGQAAGRRMMHASRTLAMAANPKVCTNRAVVVDQGGCRLVEKRYSTHPPTLP